MATESADVPNPHLGIPPAIWGSPDAPRAVLALHGRGQSAVEVRELAARTRTPAQWIAAIAHDSSWYPFRFMDDPPDDDRHVDWALEAVDAAVRRLEAEGRRPADVVLVGFSQGACLAAEYTLRTRRRFAGVAVLTGGYLGPVRREFAGDLDGMPALFATSAEDSWVPLRRVRETDEAFARLGAHTRLLVEPGDAHGVSSDAVRELDALIAAAGRH